MGLQSTYGVNSSLMWAYQRWSSVDPATAVTGRVYSGDALKSATPAYAHRVDEYTPGSVASDWSSWSLRSTWTQAAASVAATQPTLTAPAQQFIVSSATADLASQSPDAISASVINAVSPVLGMTGSDVTAGLAAGQSLADLAAANGTSHGDLVNAVRGALPDLHDPILQTSAAEDLVDHAGPLDTSALQLPASEGGDQTQVLALSLDNTARLLSLNPTDLMTQLSGGASLNSIADSVGISRDALQSAVQTDLPPQTPGWTDRAALAQQLASDTASTTEVPTAGQQFTVDLGSGPQTVTMSLDNTSAALSLAPSDVMFALSNGSTLNDLADAVGVSHATVLNAVSADLPSWAPAWTDPTALAQQLVDDPRSTTIQPPTPLPTTGQQFGVTPAGGTSPQTMTISLDATAALLSTTTTDLMAQLSAGTSLTTLAAGQSVSHDDLLNAIITDLPAQTPGFSDITTLAEQVAGSTTSTSLAPPALTSDSRQNFTVDNGSGPQTLALSLTNTSSLLSATPEYVMQRLSQGSSLNDLADSRGVARSDLADALMADLPAQTPGWTDITALAQQLAASSTSTTVGPPSTTPTTPTTVQQFTVDPGDGSGPQAMGLSLDTTAATLFTTTGDLMAQLSAGRSLSSIADGLGVAHGDLVDSLLADLPAQTPGWSDVTALAEQLAASTTSVTAS